MGPIPAVANGFRKTFSWEGRASRSEFWWFYLFDILCFLPLLYPAAELDMPAILLVWTLGLPTLLSVTVRRLHDTGRHGGWIFIGMVPTIGYIILLVFLVGEGQIWENQYGPPPPGTMIPPWQLAEYPPQPKWPVRQPDPPQPSETPQAGPGRPHP